ncbi:MAG: hypothetical protein KGZ92_09955 [Firmicutes bacterium]|nr:hypothetical protein [Dethiobacter sp.]MBS3889587.1 hypothetical protein [Bacillota bacterium]MBS4054073.1 hypothetical protein [Thermaerobacter sp.]
MLTIVVSDHMCSCDNSPQEIPPTEVNKMRDIQVPVALVTALIMALGTYFSYNIISKSAAIISRYTFLFFLTMLLTQLVGLVQLLVVDPSTIINVSGWLIVSQTSFALTRFAYAVLAFGCYVSFRDSAKH